MADLFVDEYGSTVRYSGGRIVITDKEDRELAGVRLQEIESVLICVHAAVTSAAMQALLRAGAEVVFLDGGGEYVGRLLGTFSKNAGLRLSQHNALADSNFRLEVSKRFVEAKLANMSAIVLRQARERGIAGLVNAAERIQASAQSASTAQSLSALLGMEGTGTREYYAALSIVIQPPFNFNGRNRRPPKDPVNAIIGFGCALLEGVVEGALYTAGLDPYFGIYHQDSYGRESLVFDLMEEFRPVIADSLAVTCCNKRMLDPIRDFEERDGGVFLNETGRQRFYRAFHTRMRETVKPSPQEPEMPYRNVVLHQARKLAVCFAEKDSNYRPFRIR